jgi:phenylacetate-CoA ligase
LSILDLTVPLVHVPIGGLCTSETTMQYMRETSANVVFATVTTLIKLAKYLITLGQKMTGIRVLMFSGEAFYEDQRARVVQAFPHAKLRSLIYGSIDAGALGYSISAEDTRLQAVSKPYVVLEITPNGSTPTTERCSRNPSGNKSWSEVAAYFRYPCGDLAERVDYDNGTFRVLGRDTTGVRLGPVSIDMVHLRQIVRTALEDAADIRALQAVISRADLRDVLTLRISYLPVDVKAMKQSIVDALNDARPMFLDHVQRGLIKPLQVELLYTKDFKINSTTGKLAELVDERPTV